MSDFYDSYRKLYAILFLRGSSFIKKTASDQGQIEAFSEMVEEMEALCSALQRARRTVIDAGRDPASFSREVERALWLTGVANDLLLAALDGAEEIRAGKSELDAVNKKLDTMSKNAAKLAGDLGKVTSVLDQVAKLLKLIGNP